MNTPATIPARLTTRNGRDPVLNSVHITADLRGLLLQAQVVQQFHNPSDVALEVVYSFPLPWGAVLMGVDVVLGERRLSGAVVEKRQAQAGYEAALAAGDAAILLEKNTDQTYTLNLGNLAPHEACRITVRYAQLLQFEQRGLRLVIPTVIAPRFGDPIMDGGLAPHQVPEHDLSSDHRFSAALCLHDALADARVASPSHAISLMRSREQDRDSLRVSLAQAASLDRDFVLVLDQLPQSSAAVLATDVEHPQRVMAMVAFCPRLVASEPSAVRVKILVDCSGSMNGDSIDAARHALQAVIAQFQPKDLFSMSRFGQTVEHQSAGLQRVTTRSQRAARQWTDRLQADLGGTEMAQALSATFGLSGTDAWDDSDGGDVLMVTDGEIEAIDHALQTVSRAGHRLFIVGIGSSPATSHLQRLAEATGGACDFLAPGEAVMPAVLRMFARLRSPRVSELSVAWPEGAEPRWRMGPPSAVFDGDTVQVFALFDRAPAPGEVTLRARLPGRDNTEVIASATLSGQVQSLDTVSRMAVAARLQWLGIDRKGRVDPMLTTRAIAYQLLTSRTQFLLVHERAEADKAVDMPDLHKVAQMMPAGWGGLGSVAADAVRGKLGAYTVNAPGLDYNSYDTPAVWRTPRAPAPADKTPRIKPADMLPIPSFLRAQAKDTIPLKAAGALRQAATPPRQAARPLRDALQHPRQDSGVRQAHVAGQPMTPLDLADWLSRQPDAQWPRSVQTLAELGLPAGLIAWLKDAVQLLVPGSSFSEADLVQAFLFVMNLPETRIGLEQLETLDEGHLVVDARLPDWLERAARVFTPRLDVVLVRAMLVALGPARANAWPPAIVSVSLAGA